MTGTKQLDPTMAGVADELGQVDNVGSCSTSGGLNAIGEIRATYTALIQSGSLTYQDQGRNVVIVSQNENGSLRSGDMSEGFGSNLAAVVPLLPTTKQDCKNGGWQNYGIFKNQGDCVSFVATGGKNPPSGG